MEWRPVHGLEGRYEVSDEGVVRGLDRWREGRWGNKVFVPGVVIKTRIGRHGYEQVLLGHGVKQKKHHLVHTLVLEAFVCPRPEGLVCNHLDCDRTNNRLSNLEWVTCKENNQYRQTHGNGLKGERAHKAKLTAEQVIEIRRLRAEGWTQQRLADKFGIAQANISVLLRGKSWAHV